MHKQHDDVYLFLKKHFTSNLTASEEQVSLFCSKFKAKRTKRNEILLHAGEVNPYMYFVNSGCLRIYMMDAEGCSR